MTTFDNREHGFENLFAHDKEVEFKISARMAHLFGLWAAEKIAIVADAAENYAQSFVELVVKKEWKSLVASQVHQDFTKAGVDITIQSIEAEMERFFHVAAEQVINAVN